MNTSITSGIRPRRLPPWDDEGGPAETHTHKSLGSLSYPIRKQNTLCSPSTTHHSSFIICIDSTSHGFVDTYQPDVVSGRNVVTSHTHLTQPPTNPLAVASPPTLSFVLFSSSFLHVTSVRFPPEKRKRCQAITIHMYGIANTMSDDVCLVQSPRRKCPCTKGTRSCLDTGVCVSGYALSSCLTRRSSSSSSKRGGGLSASRILVHTYIPEMTVEKRNGFGFIIFWE